MLENFVSFCLFPGKIRSKLVRESITKRLQTYRCIAFFRRLVEKKRTERESSKYFRFPADFLFCLYSF